MKRKEIKWRREGRRVMTGRQDGVIFQIWAPYDAPEKGYSVSSNDTKGKGRSINTAGHKAFPTWEEAVEFCQQIVVGEVDLKTMREEFDAQDAAKERQAIRKAKGDGRALSAAMAASPWVWRLQQADMCAAWVDEREAAEE